MRSCVSVGLSFFVSSSWPFQCLWRAALLVNSNHLEIPLGATKLDVSFYRSVMLCAEVEMWCKIKTFGDITITKLS